MLWFLTDDIFGGDNVCGLVVSVECVCLVWLCWGWIGGDCWVRYEVSGVPL